MSATLEPRRLWAALGEAGFALAARIQPEEGVRPGATGSWGPKQADQMPARRGHACRLWAALGEAGPALAARIQPEKGAWPGAAGSWEIA